MSLFSRKNENDKEIKKLNVVVNQILSLNDKYENLSDDELREVTTSLKARIILGESLDSILPEAYALVKEAAKRVIGIALYPVQLMGGIVLHQGRIAEMKTGEGKTYTCLLPAFLNALEGKGVHVVTVNDYLAKRDKEDVGRVHEFLGLSTGVILNDMKPEERQAAYNCDITYVTNNELGFDYLRDNMAKKKEDQVLRGLHYAIIDEADSILIDEARTPLIISGSSKENIQLYQFADVFVTTLREGTRSTVSKMDILAGERAEETGDYIVEKKDKIANLTERGVMKAEKFFRIDNLSDLKNVDILRAINNALRAHTLFEKDVDYVVKDDEVLIVDEFTGRILPGRRFSDGLHQALEAKEHVKIQNASNTLATITFQNFFNKFDKKAGMTGTAKTEEEEFIDVYGMDVVVIPTNKPLKRLDWEDKIFKTKDEKFDAIIDEIIDCHRRGQPVLVGTVSVEISEYLSERLNELELPHTVLNAKNHEKEAEIVSHAGERGSITIATNMAGRGTDIKLSDDTKDMGLKVIGTERHESRRIDNQLVGRSGRQGDYGESQFIISLEDDLFIHYCPERLLKAFNNLEETPGKPLNNKTLANATSDCQKRIESEHRDVRKRLCEYDEVINSQRDKIYEERKVVLDGIEPMTEEIKRMSDAFIEDLVEVSCENNKSDSWDMDYINDMFSHAYNYPSKFVLASDSNLTENPEDDCVVIGSLIKYTKKELVDDLTKTASELLSKKEASFSIDGIKNDDALDQVQRRLLLGSVDRFWQSHIDYMDRLKQGIGLAAYGQKDPVTEYRLAGFDAFEEVMKNIRLDVISTFMHLKLNIVTGEQYQKIQEEKELA